MPNYLYRCEECGNEVNFSAPVGDVAPGDCGAVAPPLKPGWSSENLPICAGRLKRVWAVNIQRGWASG